MRSRAALARRCPPARPQPAPGVPWAERSKATARPNEPGGRASRRPAGEPRTERCREEAAARGRWAAPRAEERARAPAVRAAAGPRIPGTPSPAGPSRARVLRGGPERWGAAGGEPFAAAPRGGPRPSGLAGPLARPGRHRRAKGRRPSRLPREQPTRRPAGAPRWPPPGRTSRSPAGNQTRSFVPRHEPLPPPSGRPIGAPFPYGHGRSARQGLTGWAQDPERSPFVPSPCAPRLGTWPYAVQTVAHGPAPAIRQTGRFAAGHTA